MNPNTGVLTELTEMQILKLTYYHIHFKHAFSKTRGVYL